MIKLFSIINHVNYIFILIISKICRNNKLVPLISRRLMHTNKLHAVVTTYIIHLVFEADVDFVAFGQCRLKLVKLLSIEGQL